MKKIPRHQQIALQIRYELAFGTLAPGDRLLSLRQASARWGVCLHTVRRAYRSLHAAGIIRTVERGGSVVAQLATPPATDIDVFVASIARTARDRFGLDREEMAARLLGHRRDGSRETLWVVECSGGLADRLAKQVARHWDVRARGITLDEMEHTGAGTFASTYYHAEEVLAASSRRNSRADFLAVELDPMTVERVRGSISRGSTHLTFVGADASTLEAMSRNLAEAVRDLPPIDRLVGIAELRWTRRTRNTAPIIVSPAIWDALSGADRTDPNIIPYWSRFREPDVIALGRSRLWRSRES